MLVPLRLGLGQAWSVGLAHPQLACLPVSPTVTTIRVLEKFIDSHLKNFEWLKGSILSELVAGSRNDMQAGYILFMQRGSILFCSGSVCVVKIKIVDPLRNRSRRIYLRPTRDDDPLQPCAH